MPRHNSYFDYETLKKIHANFMKPARNVEEIRSVHKPCKMNTKDKNLWISGDKEKVREFFHNAVDDHPIHVFYRCAKWSWSHYHDQPFIVYPLYDKKNRQDIISELRRVGEWSPRNVGKDYKYEINPDCYHCIVLSTFTPEEYCKGMDHEDIEVGGLKWRYDTLQLK